MLLRIVLLLCLNIILSSCKNDHARKPKAVVSKYLKMKGKTMGTFYNITYEQKEINVTQEEIDSILRQINLSVSTYIDSSTISMINHSTESKEAVTILADGEEKTFDAIELSLDTHFINNYKISEKVYLETSGNFDPTIMPLVNYWGFGYTPKKAVTEIDQEKVDKILTYVGMDKFNLEAGSSGFKIIKHPKAELDFSAVAKGYAVDELANYLKSKNVENLMVDIGGEVYAKGHSPSGKHWRIGLNTPKENAGLREVKEIIELKDIAVASSGNYRIFHKVNGKKYGHEINPKTGHPELNDLLAISVTAPTCAEADAVATAAMIMGLEKAYKHISDYAQLEACFFFSDSIGVIQSRYTEGMSKLVVSN